MSNVEESLSKVPPCDGNNSLKECDPEIYNLILKEKLRQIEGIELIASENFASKAVFEALGSCMNNKYAEGYPGARYYAGTEIIDKCETLCQNRALKLFNLDPKKWGVNVQPLSGSPANFQAYTALIPPHGRIMGLDLPHGGHLSHGFMTPKKRISATSVFFESMPYQLNEETGMIDYEAMHKSARLFRPQILIAGYSAHSREYNYKRMRQIADDVGAYLLSDISHISGLLAAGVMAENPFEYSDIVTTTTHKTLRGPRGGMIYFRRGIKETPKVGGAGGGDAPPVYYDYEEKINWAVFPGTQGGPHVHQIAAMAVALHEAMQPSFIEYQKQVLNNSRTLANEMMNLGYTIVSGGTDNHLFLLDLRAQQIDGSRVEKVLEKALITVNKNTVPGDTRPMVPSGLRIGTPAFTSRGMKESDCKIVAEFLHRGIQIAIAINSLPDAHAKLASFKEILDSSDFEDLSQLRADVLHFASRFPIPG